jgi:extracellular factor (EF) 3-hydroxypalmitic acid methyl ester biosynthesis protein
VKPAFSKCALFAELTPDELTVVVAKAMQYSVPAKHVFLNMGVCNKSLFVVLSGSVCIERIGTLTDRELRTLRPGETFGEMSFIDGSKTIAKVTAVEPTEVLELFSTDFQRILADYPALASKLWRNLALDFKRRIAITTDLVDHYADLGQVLHDNPRIAALILPGT